MIIKALKYVWVSPVTIPGLVAVGLTSLSGGSVQIVGGVVEACGGFSEWMITRGLGRRVSCMTVGHVILGLDAESLGRARQHEHVHVRQYEKWGALFVPLYLGSSLVAWMRGKHYYRDNLFEREAYGKAP